jgi:hypothetical protein
MRVVCGVHGRREDDGWWMMDDGGPESLRARAHYLLFTRAVVPEPCLPRVLHFCSRAKAVPGRQGRLD